jgi:hypothetical protein
MTRAPIIAKRSVAKGQGKSDEKSNTVRPSSQPAGFTHGSFFMLVFYR